MNLHASALAASLAQSSFKLSSPPAARNPMRVTKRNGAHEPVDVNKIVRAVTRCCEGMHDVDPMRVALKTIAGLFDGATTRELDELSIRTAASFMVEDPEYSKLAARLLAAFIDKEVQGQGIYSFSQSIRAGFDVGLINERVLHFVESHARKLNDAIDADAHPQARILRLAHPVRPLLAASHPTRAQRDRNPAVLLDAHGGGA